MKTTVLIFGLATLVLLSGCVSGPGLQSEMDSIISLQAEKIKTVKPIMVIGHNADYPNSAGGVGVIISFQNLSGKVIKYGTFTVTPINRVGDETVSSIGREGTLSLTATGPFGQDFSDQLRWKNVWYNNTITFVRIDRVQIDYMDGTKEVIEGDAIAGIELRPGNNLFSSGLQQTRQLTIRGSHLDLYTRTN